MASKPRRVGGMTEPQQANDEVQALVDRVRADVEESLGRKLAKYEAKIYGSQLVNGVNYFVKVDTGDDTFVHIRLHKSFQDVVSFADCQDAKMEKDPLSYF